MPIIYDKIYQEQLQEMSDILELINYRPRTKESYLNNVAECCEWLGSTYHISIDGAAVSHLRAFLAYLHRPIDKGGRGLMPRTINVYNCSIKRFFQFVLKKELTSRDLPVMKVDNPLPKVPSKKEAATLIMGTENPKHRLMLAMAYGCALRMTEVISLRFGDISFSRNLVTVRAENSKNRCEETVVLPSNLRAMLYRYYHDCMKGARQEDWLFPGRRAGTHISKGVPGRVMRRRLEQLGWSSRGYSFHSLRHGHALHYYLAGADIHQVQVRLRHRSISSTTIYVRLAGMLQERRNIENPFDDPAFKG